jgi:hypothetical protein
MEVTCSSEMSDNFKGKHGISQESEVFITPAERTSNSMEKQRNKL